MRPAERNARRGASVKSLVQFLAAVAEDSARDDYHVYLLSALEDVRNHLIPGDAFSRELRGPFNATGSKFP
jgi:hypothetical protein